MLITSPVSMSHIFTVRSLLEVISFLLPVPSLSVVIAKTSSVWETSVFRYSADFGCHETSEFLISLNVINWQMMLHVPQEGPWICQHRYRPWAFRTFQIPFHWSLDGYLAWFRCQTLKPAPLWGSQFYSLPLPFSKDHFPVHFSWF